MRDSELDQTLTGFDNKEAADLIAQFTFKSDEDAEFTNEVLDLDDFAEDKFDCHCPRCTHFKCPFKNLPNAQLPAELFDLTS
ncbi:hypothetical protein QIH01_09135 [Brevibacillus brevis]|nr:hypothetical protein QIH01_09135 [Brevibacillus brevis]